MKVQCQKCRKSFLSPVQSAGKIDYERCKNVFRVTYRFRTSCPECQTVLQLVPQGSSDAIGIPLPFDPTENTETFAVVSADDPTVAKMDLEKSDIPDEPPPTVRVAKIQQSESDKTEIKNKETPRFRVIGKDRKRKTPVHMRVRDRKKIEIPWMKIGIGAIFAGSLSITVLLSSLVFQSSSDKPTRAETPSSIQSSEVKIAPVIKKDPPRLIQSQNKANESPKGGPESEMKLEINEEPVKSDEKTASVTTHETETNKTILGLPDLSKITSTYGYRLDPFTKNIAFHGGVDFKMTQRSEVEAALDGTVKYVGKKGGYGNVVIIKHADGYETLYGHLAKALIKEGKKVKQGELIGLAGSTGRSTGPHLHFELWKGNKKVDPLRIKLISRKS